MDKRARQGIVCAAVLATALGAAGCKDTTIGAGKDPGTPGQSGPATTGAPVVSDGHAVSPLANPDGTKPGLAAITTATDRARARALIVQVTTKGRGPKTGYSRDQFGYAWMDSVPDVPFGHNGCDTRDDLIKRDGQDLGYRKGSNCVVTSMTLNDPYTGRVIHWIKAKATTVQIDHVMPLSYDWQMGAAQWSKTKREEIANDPLNLIPVDGPSNGAKSDSGPATWLPPNKQIRCSYVVRVAQVSLKYHLPVTSADKQAMLAQCAG
ncbi:HNH endonuclease family protein [Actinacidiphila acididurans]|uniref:HNH endonuclease n=1 Tax=Actinacidiphila acididurans TaxID=2784346 RepID=A0ABS2TNS5_9ACTN|nr:HNH endonuclease family protein [Actinacidiphila acididurans]MBM9504990.1 HNH endonuclease [Actinacidiphila acididurans]